MRKHYSIAKEELSLYGADCTSLQNILAVIIGPKADSAITGQLAGLGVNQLCMLSKSDLLNFEGIGEASADRILSALGLANIIRKQQKEDRFIIKSPQDAANYFNDLEYLNQEHFDVLFLNTKNEVISRKNIFKGTLNASVVHPRDVMREAFKVSAASIILGHNHPSGRPDESKEDIEVTKRLVSVGQTMGIDVLDHIIIGNAGRFISLKEKGYL